MSSTYKEIEPKEGRRRPLKSTGDSRNFRSGAGGLSRGAAPGLWDLPQSPGAASAEPRRTLGPPGGVREALGGIREDPGGKGGRASPGLWHRTEAGGRKGDSSEEPRAGTQRCWLASEEGAGGPEAGGLGGPVTALQPQQHCLHTLLGL